MAEANLCELHRVPLKERTVQIRYGLPAYDPSMAIRAELFPNSHSYALGGCVIDDEPAEPYRMPVCLQCRAAERQWREANDPPSQSSGELAELFERTYQKLKDK